MTLREFCAVIFFCALILTTAFAIVFVVEVAPFYTKLSVYTLWFLNAVTSLLFGIWISLVLEDNVLPKEKRGNTCRVS